MFGNDDHHIVFKRIQGVSDVKTLHLVTPSCAARSHYDYILILRASCSTSYLVY
jgi:hypothetical protein